MTILKYHFGYFILKLFKTVPVLRFTGGLSTFFMYPFIPYYVILNIADYFFPTFSLKNSEITELFIKMLLFNTFALFEIDNSTRIPLLIKGEKNIKIDKYS